MTRRASVQQFAEERDLELILLDPPELFDAAILGLVYGYGQELVVLYSEQSVLDALVASGMTPDEAQEYFHVNTVGAYLGETTPRFFMPIPGEDDPCRKSETPSSPSSATSSPPTSRSRRKRSPSRAKS